MLEENDQHRLHIERFEAISRPGHGQRADELSIHPEHRARNRGVNYGTFFGISGVLSSGTASLIARSMSSNEWFAATPRS